MTIKQRIAAIAGGVAATALLAAAPAQAIDLGGGWNLNGKFFASVASVENDDAESGFQLNRNYLTLKGGLDGGYKLRFTLDQNAEAGNVFVKYAYVDKGVREFKLRVGLNQTPYVNWDETQFWGHRFVQESFLDFWGLQSSSNLGASLRGDAVDGKLQYHVSVMNGEAYGDPQFGSNVAISGRAGFALRPDIQIGAFIHEESRRDNIANYDPEMKVIYAFIGNQQFRAGGQIILDADYGTGGGAAPGVNFQGGDGINLQGQYALPIGQESWFFARMDKVNSGVPAAPDQDLTIIGMTMKLNNNLTIAPNLQMFDNGGGGGSVNSYLVNAQLKF